MHLFKMNGGSSYLYGWDWKLSRLVLDDTRKQSHWTEHVKIKLIYLTMKAEQRTLIHVLLSTFTELLEHVFMIYYKDDSL